MNEIEQHFSAALDSVAIVTALVAKAPLTTEEKDRLVANANHLQIMIAKSIFTTEQMETLQTSVDLAATIATLDAAPPTTVPQSVSMRQARRALLAEGLLITANDAIAAMQEPAKSAAIIDWEYSSEVYRNSVLVISVGGALGLTYGQLDALFVAASAL